MEQENRMLYAWYHDLKRKCQNYNSKKSPNPDSSEGEEEVPESQMGNINLYNHDDEIGGWLQLSLQHQKMAPLAATKFAKAMTNSHEYCVLLSYLYLTLFLA